jgi:hypothetical protein
VALFKWLKPARAAHRPTGRVWPCKTRREKIAADRWRDLIGQRDFYPILSLNSIISLQNNFLIFFYNKELIF